jgi:molybdopterin/thiamine biosynthesis adenylyltransferase
MTDNNLSENNFYEKAFSRNIGILTEKEQEKIKHSKIAIAGMGGVGGHYILNFARLGIKHFSIADFDSFEEVNINRQAGATIDTFGKKKCETMGEMAKKINPYIKINYFKEGVNEKNVDDFLSGVDVYVDGMDAFDIETRRLIFKKAREKGIFAITAAPLGFSCAMLVFSPRGMSFDVYFGINDQMSYVEKIASFLLGVAPFGIHLRYLNLEKVDLKNGKGPSVSPACYLCSALATTMATKILLKKKGVKAAPHYFQFDAHENTHKKGYLLFGGKNPIMLLKKKIFLKFFLKN